MPSLRQTQAAAFTQPDRGAQLLLQFFHAVAERRLRNMEHPRGGSQRALFFHLLHDE